MNASYNPLSRGVAVCLRGFLNAAPVGMVLFYTYKINLIQPISFCISK